MIFIISDSINLGFLPTLFLNADIHRRKECSGKAIEDGIWLNNVKSVSNDEAKESREELIRVLICIPIQKIYFT